MTPSASLAVRSAALPFARVWKTLDPAFEVVSLGSPQDSWKQLLAGQGIGLKEGTDRLPQDTAVATGFDRLDSCTAETLENWAREALAALRPGGLLVLGGANPEHHGTTHQGLFPEVAVRALRRAGFARVCAIRPGPPADDTSLQSVFYGGSDTYAVVAQKEAFGKAFDVFSPVFLEASATAPQNALHRAEQALLERINHAEARLNARIAQIETALTARQTALQERLEQTEEALRDQRRETGTLREDIARLQEKNVELTRLTRRRGLRKLMHRIKLKWRARRAEPMPVPDAPPVKSVKMAPPPAPSETAPPPAVIPPARPTDPVPLSPREARLRARLFGPEAQ